MKEYSILIAVLISTGCASTQMSSTDRSSSKRVTALSSTDSARFDASGSAGSSVSGQASSSTNGVVEIPLYREELQVGKRIVSDGGVLLRKVIETDTQSEPVQLRREEFHIERVSADDARNFQAADSQNAFQEREIVIELNREVPTVEKNAIVTEVVRARTTVDSREETISGTVRQESIDIDRSMNEQNDTPASVGSSPAAEQGRATETQAQAQPATREEGKTAELFLHKEQLEVGKRVVPAGRIVLRKDVTSREVSQPIQLRDEDVSIQRAQVSADDQQQARENAFQPREFYIPLQREVPMVQKQVQLSEVIRAGKQIETQEQTVSGQVRSERIEIAEVPAGDNRSSVGSPASREQGQSTSENTSERNQQ